MTKYSNLPIDSNGKPYKRQTFVLDGRELAKIYGEINTNYGLYEGKPMAVHLSYGLDCKSYAYYFENHGFDEYNIYMRVDMDE